MRIRRRDRQARARPINALGRPLLQHLARQTGHGAHTPPLRLSLSRNVAGRAAPEGTETRCQEPN
jgi:hypothetical protein